MTVNPNASPEEVNQVVNSDGNVQIFAQATMGGRYAESQSAYKEVQQRGDVTITSGLVQIAPTMRSFYTEDPDGMPVEFLQVSK